MPTVHHHTLSAESPQAPVLPKGEPLSTRITLGKPARRNRPIKTRRTAAWRWCGRIRTARRKRLNRSRTVSGSQRVPSAVRKKPLKSTVQTSLGAAGWVKGGKVRRGPRREGRVDGGAGVKGL